MSDWFYSINHQQKGPISESSLLELVRQGTVKSDTMVWKEGMPEWVAFSQSSMVGGSDLVKCAFSGEMHPSSTMMQYGDSWIRPEYKEAFIQNLHEGPAATVEALRWEDFEFIDPKGRARLAKAGIVIMLGTFVLLFIGGMIYGGYMASQNRAEEIDMDQVNLVSTIAVLIPFALFNLFYLMWVHRVSKNAHAIYQRSMDQTPGWAVGFYFIPIMALWKPYVSMREIWNASQRKPLDTGSQLVGWWWGVWVAWSILGGFLPILGLPVAILKWILITNVTRFQRDIAGIE